MAGTSNVSDLTTNIEDIEAAQEAQKIKYRGSNKLGKEEFLKLLVCQMQNQDPLNPQNDTEFVSQLAQFSSLEQMTNMNATMSNTSAYSLIGREVIVQKADETGQYKETRGVVDYVGFENGEAVISVDGKKFSMEDIVKVLDTAYAAKDYLPSVEEQKCVYDLNNPTPTEIKINLGSNGYEANSVVVAINGDYIDKKYLTFDAEEGILTIAPDALKDLDTGSYYLGLYFDDPYQTSITDKVTIQITNSGANTDDKEDTEGDTEGETEGETEEKDKA